MNDVLEIRTRAQLTQDELAERSGVAQPNIAAYETGRRKPSSAMLARLRASARLPHELLAEHRHQILEISRKHGMTNVHVFGSAASQEDVIGSDLDLMVTPPDGIGLWQLSAYAQELEDLLGIRVDIVTPRGLRPGHRILETARSL